MTNREKTIDKERETLLTKREKNLLTKKGRRKPYWQREKTY